MQLFLLGTANGPPRILELPVLRDGPINIANLDSEEPFNGGAVGLDSRAVGSIDNDVTLHSVRLC